MSTWLNKLTTKDGKLAATPNGKSSKNGSRSITPSPSLPKISLPPTDPAMPKVVLIGDDDSISPMTVSPSSVHRADSMSTPGLNSTTSRTAETSGHRKYTTVANDEIPVRQADAMSLPSAAKPTRSRSNSQVEPIADPQIPISESPTQSITSRRSGSIASGESAQFQSLQQLVDSPPPLRQRVVSVDGAVPSEETTSPGKKRRSGRQHASSVGAGSPTGKGSKPPTRHQTTMGMGLANDYLIDDYGCALQRDILIQGRLYISENHICFHANIFGWVTDLIIPVNGITAVEKKMTAFVIPNAIGVTERSSKHTFASFLARDTAYDVMYSVWRNGGHSRSVTTPPGSEPTPGPGRDSGFSGGPGDAAGSRPQRRATQCSCLKAGIHYPNTAMEVVVPGTPEQIYNLMFASGFIKDFLSQNQKLMDIQTSDWQPSPENQHLLSRNMSYIKPLSGGFGPKQTKCELRDENQHVDFNDYASTITTTRTPEVPSGGVFSVKTRTCIMWAGNSSTKVMVTFTVEWTGKSFIKGAYLRICLLWANDWVWVGIIERSCMDGQRVYYSDLEAAMRQYIQEHRTEFLADGVDADAADNEAEAEEAALSPGAQKDKDAAALQPTGPKPVATSRGLQWALDTFEAASKC
ncbi:hypothetical protein FRB91_003013 [Serendipita sp. 411]|nr:hypothetical protein FRB91_003013 [Serendipita sp. 411]